MSRTKRQFEDKPAERKDVPLIGICVGPPGSGKTVSTARLAIGMREVVGGEVFLIDTEMNRARHYADEYKFRHVAFEAPFGSLDYWDAIDHCLQKGAKVIVVDSFTHEHQGPGGYLEQHEELVEKYGGDNEKARERNSMRAWAKVAPKRTFLLHRMWQAKCHFLLTFWAKEKAVPIKDQDGKLKIVDIGWQPLGGPPFFYAATFSCLLLPGSKGVPDWSQESFKNKVAKMEDHHKACFKPGKQLDEETGRQLAEWARGGVAAAKPEPQSAGTSVATAGPQKSHENLTVSRGTVIAVNQRRGAKGSAYWTVGMTCEDGVRELVTKDKATADILQNARDGGESVGVGWKKSGEYLVIESVTALDLRADNAEPEPVFEEP